MALQLLRLLNMPDPNDSPGDEERVSKRVVYETSSSSGSTRSTGTVIIVLVVVAIIIVAFIFSRMH